MIIFFSDLYSWNVHYLLDTLYCWSLMLPLCYQNLALRGPWNYYMLLLISCQYYYKYDIMLLALLLPEIPNNFDSLFDYPNRLLSQNDKTRDLDFPDIDWNTFSGRSRHSDHFCDKVYNFNLSQCVPTPTHILGNILNVVLTSSCDLVFNLLVHDDALYNHNPHSDHFKITFSIPLITLVQSLNHIHTMSWITPKLTGGACLSTY